MVLVVYTHIKVLRLFCKEWFHWDCVNNVVVPVHRSVTARCWWLPGGGAGGCLVDGGRLHAVVAATLLVAVGALVHDVLARVHAERDQTAAQPAAAIDT